MNFASAERHDKVWGTEYWLTNDLSHCCKALVLTGGFQCSLHYHEEKDETFFVVSGEVLMETGSATIGEERAVTSRVMRAGDYVRIAPYTVHRFTGMADSSLLVEASSHHREEDSHRLEMSGKVSAD